MMIVRKFFWYQVEDRRLAAQGLHVFRLEWRGDPNNWRGKSVWLNIGVIGVVEEEEYVLGKISVPCISPLCSGPAWLIQREVKLWMMKCDKCGGWTPPAHAKAKSMFFEYQAWYKERNGEGPPLIIHGEREA